MDENIYVITANHYTPPNLISSHNSFASAMRLPTNSKNPLAQFISNEKISTNNLRVLYQFDPELRIIKDFLESKYIGFDNSGVSVLGYNYLLDLPTNIQDIKLRQDLIKRITSNDSLFQKLEQIISEANNVFEGVHFCSDISNVIMTPEILGYAFSQLREFCDLDNSEAMQKFRSWIKNLEHDSLFCELLKDKRMISESRFALLPTERFDNAAIAVLKPGLEWAEVVDFIGPEMQQYDLFKTVRGKRKTITQKVIKFKTIEDENLQFDQVAKVRQRIDVLNKITAKAMFTPLYFTYLQLKHFYQGAFFHRVLEKEGINTTYPVFTDEEGVFSVEELEPIRLILYNLGRYGHIRDKLCPNSFNFSPLEKIIQIEGPNNSGKSEAWRSVHLMNALANAGFCVPAKKVVMNPSPKSHFISLKGNRGYGGSELENGSRELFKNLKEIFEGDIVILDELGDATNSPTAEEFATRILPPIIEKASRVFVTSHHNSSTSFIKNKLKGTSLMPNPNGEGINKFRIVSAKEEVDFKPGEVLDELGITSKKIKTSMPVSKNRGERKFTQVFDERGNSLLSPEEEYELDQEIPF